MDLIAETLEDLERTISETAGLSRISPEEASAARDAIFESFGFILHPRYNTRCNMLPYFQLADTVSSLRGWTMVVSTNWDYLADGAFEAAFQNLFGGIDWGLGNPNQSLWLGAIPQMAVYADEATNQPFISFYKPNGSTGWHVCRKDRLIFARHFHRPHNLDDVVTMNFARGLPNAACPRCANTMLPNDLYARGVSRQIHPLKAAMDINLIHAAQHCDSLTFVGYSCPPEDDDLVDLIANAIANSDPYRDVPLVPKVIDIAGPHSDATRDRYAQKLSRSVEYYDRGFTTWLATTARQDLA
jgi:hypothetical protein